MPGQVRAAFSENKPPVLIPEPLLIGRYPVLSQTKLMKLTGLIIMGT